MTELIVVACHGPDWIDQCRTSLLQHTDADVLFVRTDGHDPQQAGEPLPDYLDRNRGVMAIPGGYSTGAYLRAVTHSVERYDRFLFMQDSMTAIEDPLPWFRDQWTGSGAVAWQRFPMQWDNVDQMRVVEERYTSSPSHGIFGPVWYTDRESLSVLSRAGLLPEVPASRLEAQAAERAWAYAYTQAGMPVVGPEWNPDAMQSPQGFGPFRKVFAARP